MAVFGGDDAQPGEVGALRLGDRADPRERSDQHRHDQPPLCGLERAHQRVGVAGMDHRAADRLERRATGQQPREYVVPPQVHLRGREPGVLESLGRHLDDQRAREHAHVAATHLGLEHCLAGVGTLFAHGDPRRQPLAGAQAPCELELLRDDPAAGSRQAPLHQAGHQRQRADRVDAGHGACSIGHDFAGDQHQRLDLRAGERALHAGGRAGREFVERDVAVVVHGPGRLS